MVRRSGRLSFLPPLELLRRGTTIMDFNYQKALRAKRIVLIGLLLSAGIVITVSRQGFSQTPVPPMQQPTVVNTGNIVNIVGGVRVSVEGVLAQQDDRSRAEVLEARRKAMQTTPSDMNQATKLRMVSLRKLDEAIKQCAESGRPLPDEIRYLAGLQRVQYVFVYPDQKDIVLAGPAEGWKINELGNVVGNVSGHPVMQLDDLLVALRCADDARKGGIDVSIDPTPQGLQNLRAYLEKQQGQIGPNPQATIAGIEETLGPQTITIHGVPTNSRFANVLVAADYRMKRLAMNFEPAPVKGMPSYLEMVAPAARGMPNMMPRWWLAPKYEPLATDGEGLAWEIRGPGVQCMAEADYFSTTGQRQSTTKANPAAQKWADAMTSHYDELSQKDAIFGDLRNCMDMAVVGALIVKENMLDKAELHPQFLYNTAALPTVGYNPPKQVDSKASFVKKGKNYVISASGGVQFQPWDMLNKKEVSAAVSPLRTAAAKTRSTTWWWN
jgi:hypothetical protein